MSTKTIVWIIIISSQLIGWQIGYWLYHVIY